MDKVELIDWDKYIIYENGDVYSKHYNTYLSNKPNKNGYCQNYYLLTDGTKQKCYRHRVIYYYFNGEIPDGYEIDHIDGNRVNNSLDNLRIGTHTDNVNNPITLKRNKDSHIGQKASEETRRKLSDAKLGNLNKKKLPINQYDLDGNFIRRWESAREAEREIGINNVVKCLKGTQSQAGGYKWKYA